MQRVNDNDIKMIGVNLIPYGVKLDFSVFEKHHNAVFSTISASAWKHSNYMNQLV